MENSTPNTESAKKSGAAFGADAGAQEKILKQISELGDSLERVGEKIEKGGWETVGQAIYKLGDTLEHLKSKTGTKSAYSGERKYTDAEYDRKTKNPADSKKSDSARFSDSKVRADQAKTDAVGGDDSQAY